MERRWFLLLAAAGVIALNGIVFAVFWPQPLPPPGASPAERVYLARCASCHGARGTGSWRATFFLIRPGDLSNPGRMTALPNQYLFDVIKHGGATIGKPGMPGFGFHLSDTEITELVRYVRSLAADR